MAAYSIRRFGAALALVGLAGCAVLVEAPGGVSVIPFSDPARLMPVGSTWTVTGIAETVLPTDNGMLIRRETRQGLTGTTACNSFGARLVRRGVGMAITDLTTTERACVGYAAQHEAALTGALARVNGVMSGSDGDIVLARNGVGLVTLAPVLAPPPPKAARN